MKLKLLFLLILFLSIPTISSAEGPSEPRIDKKPPDMRVDVIKAKLAGNGYFVDIQFRIHEGSGGPNPPMPYPRNVYVIEESTGEKFLGIKLGRVGTLGQKRLDEGLISVVRIDNARGKIKKDSRITLVVGRLRQEHIVVEE